MIIGSRTNPKSSEGLGTWSPPETPTAVYVLPLVSVSSIFYMCGGAIDGISTAECYTLNAEEKNPKWRPATPLREPMWGHSAVAIGSRIWFASSLGLYDYETTTGETRVHRLQFSPNYHDCAVSNNTHSYMIGGVFDKNATIRVNTFASHPSEWTAVANLPLKTYGSSCVWFGNEIYIVGGRSGTTYLRDAFAMDTNTHRIRRLANLNIPREEARMMVLDCKPAVVGGTTTSHRVLSSIEVYDNSKNVWELHNLNLETPRTAFGLSQLTT